MAVAIYNNYRYASDIEVSFVAATPKWAITTKKNKRCRKLLTGLGFKQEGVHPFAGENQATAITYGLYSEPAKKWVESNG